MISFSPGCPKSKRVESFLHATVYVSVTSKSVDLKGQVFIWGKQLGRAGAGGAFQLHKMGKGGGGGATASD